MVSFEVVPLFANVPISTVMSLVNEHFDDDILRLSCHVLNSCNLSSGNQFYQQTEVLASYDRHHLHEQI
jgi:hypothetical protein